MGSIAFWLVFGCCLAALFLFWAGLSAIMSCLLLHDQDEEAREFFADRELTRVKNEDLLISYYTARGWSAERIQDLLCELDCSYPMSHTELVDYAARRELDPTIRSNV